MHFIDVVLPPIMRTLHQRFEKAASNASVIDLQESLLEVTTGLMGRIAYDASKRGILVGNVSDRDRWKCPLRCRFQRLSTMPLL